MEIKKDIPFALVQFFFNGLMEGGVGDFRPFNFPFDIKDGDIAFLSCCDEHFLPLGLLWFSGLSLSVYQNQYLKSNGDLILFRDEKALAGLYFYNGFGN
jgi:hypothetical protein